MLGEGGVAGAVKLAVLAPVLTMVPQLAPLQPGPETLQLSVVLGFEFGAGVSVAVNKAVALVWTNEGPATESVKLLVMLTAALALLEGSATLLAVSVTPGSEGQIGGAVKSPLASTVPQAAPAQPTPAALQVTVRFGLPEPDTLA